VPKIIDSDNDISGDGDDLLEDQLMVEVKMKCKSIDNDLKEKEKQITEDDELQLQEPDSDKEAMEYNFYQLSEEDMVSAVFHQKNSDELHLDKKLAYIELKILFYLHQMKSSNC
jgi:hypothetical protein